MNGHIKITLECIDTKNKAIFEINMNDKTANFDLKDFATDSGSELFGRAFVDTIDMLGLRKQFLEKMDSISK